MMKLHIFASSTTTNPRPDLRTTDRPRKHNCYNHEKQSS